MENMELWKKVSKPPKEALKTIGFGRLKGMTDIKPMWRFQVMTEVYGPCGVGWKFEIKKMFVQDVSYDQKFAIVEIELYTKTGDTWSDPIPGVGSGKLISIEKGKLYSNDEAFKMARTDALGSAMQMIGVAAEIYAGNWDGTKYKQVPKSIPSKPNQTTNEQPVPKNRDTMSLVTKEEYEHLATKLNENNISHDTVKQHFKSLNPAWSVADLTCLTYSEYQTCLNLLK